MARNFVMHSIDGIRIGVPLVIGHDALAAYDVIRASAWYTEETPKSADSKFGRVHRLRHEEGLIAAPLSIAEIGEACGFGTTLTKKVVRTLKEHGWLHVVLLDPQTRLHAYVVGEDVSDSKSERAHPVMFADGWINRAVKHVLRTIEVEYDDENVNLNTFTFAQRLAATRAFAEKEKARTAKARSLVETCEEDGA